MDTKDSKPVDVKAVSEKILSPFVEEGSVFNIEIQYYLEEKERGTGKFVIKNVHDDFDVTKECNKFNITLRIPTQKDAIIINNRQSKNTKGENELEIYRVFSEVEYFRFLLLVTSWTLESPCTEENINKLHPAFVKGIVTAIRNEIGMDGIV